MYAIKQTYRNLQTGDSWSRVFKKRWKTLRGAENAAKAHRWVHMPDGPGGVRVAESDAEVIEVKQ